MAGAREYFRKGFPERWEITCKNGTIHGQEPKRYSKLLREIRSKEELLNKLWNPLKPCQDKNKYTRTEKLIEDLTELRKQSDDITRTGRTLDAWRDSLFEFLEWKYEKQESVKRLEALRDWFEALPVGASEELRNNLLFGFIRMLMVERGRPDYQEWLKKVPNESERYLNADCNYYDRCLKDLVEKMPRGSGEEWRFFWRLKLQDLVREFERKSKIRSRARMWKAIRGVYGKSILPKLSQDVFGCLKRALGEALENKRMHKDGGVSNDREATELLLEAGRILEIKMPSKDTLRKL